MLCKCLRCTGCCWYFSKKRFWKQNLGTKITICFSHLRTYVGCLASACGPLSATNWVLRSQRRHHGQNSTARSRSATKSQSSNMCGYLNRCFVGHRTYWTKVLWRQCSTVIFLRKCLMTRHDNHRSWMSHSDKHSQSWYGMNIWDEDDAD